LEIEDVFKMAKTSSESPLYLAEMKQFTALKKRNFKSKIRDEAEDWDLLQQKYEKVMSSIRDVDLKSHKDYDKDPDRNWNPFKNR